MDLIRWSAVKKLICSGFEGKDEMITENYFDNSIQDSNKNVLFVFNSNFNSNQDQD